MVQILGGEVYSPAAGVKEMTEEMLEQRLTECGIPFSPDLPGKLLKYHELLLEWNPEYIFVLDRDAAIGTDGAQLAQEIMENELTMQTSAYQNGNIVYLEHPAVWYTAEGGITALDYMLSDLEGALLTE